MQGESCVAPHTGGLLEEGKDAVVDPIGETREDKLVGGIVDDTSKLGDEGCLKGDPLEPVGIAAEASADGDDDDEPKGPTLTEACLWACWVVFVIIVCFLELFNLYAFFMGRNNR